MGKFWLDESKFVGFLVQCLYGKLPEDQRLELEQYFGLGNGQFVGDCNRYLERTKKAIDKRNLSIRGLALRNVGDFIKLLTSPKLNKTLQDDFKKVLVKRLKGTVEELNDQAEKLKKEATESEKKAVTLTMEIEKDVEHSKGMFFKEQAEKLERESAELIKIAEELEKGTFYTGLDAVVNPGPHFLIFKSNKCGHFCNDLYIRYCSNKNLIMKKYCINATPKPGTDSSGTCILAFDVENLKPSYHDNVVILGCNKFSIDEANSSKNWRDAFNFNEEPPQSVLITVSPGYKSGKVMPYFE